MTVIETERLWLEPLDASRLEEFVALMADPEVTRYWVVDSPASRERAEAWFRTSLERWRELGFGKRWVVSKATGEGLGFVETKRLGPWREEIPPETIELGWMLRRSAWGLGYATEAALAIRDEAFEQLGLDHVIGLHQEDNRASCRVMAKLGFEFERVIAADDGWNYRMYRLTRDRWHAARSASSRSQPG